LIFPGKLSRETIPDDQKYQMEKQVPLLDGLNTKKNKTPSPPPAPPVPPQPQPLEQRSNIVSEKRKKKVRPKEKWKGKGNTRTLMRRHLAGQCPEGEKKKKKGPPARGDILQASPDAVLAIECPDAVLYDALAF
jgi:hypothetical protein